MRKALPVIARLVLAAMATTAAVWLFGALVLEHSGAGTADRWISAGIVGAVCGAVVIAWTGNLAVTAQPRNGTSASDAGVPVQLPVWAAVLDPVCWPEGWLGAPDRVGED